MLEFSVHRRCWSGLGQTSKQNVSKSFGVTHAIEASDFDQLAPEDSLQAFVAAKVEAVDSFLNRNQGNVKGSLYDFPVQGI
jgi:hypothetical protein